MIEQSKKWGLCIEPTKLTLQERKDAMLFLAFLNIYDDYNNALKMYKDYWLDTVHVLPSTNSAKYNGVKQTRCLAMRRIRKVYCDYITLN